MHLLIIKSAKKIISYEKDENYIDDLAMEKQMFDQNEAGEEQINELGRNRHKKSRIRAWLEHSVSYPEFDLDVHLDIFVDYFSAFLRTLFSWMFRLFPKPFFFQLSWNMKEFGKPTGSSGDAFSNVLRPKRKVGKRRSVSTEHHISRFGESLTGSSQAFLQHLFFEKRRR